MLIKLLELQKDGTLKQLVKHGLLSSKVFSYMEIYMWVDAKEKATSKSLSEIVIDAEITFDVSRATVFRALKAMK
ncbi:hypothetical protein BDD43_3504 [Mucilaginibacter gracilis]|uniref:Uncharacterized protein n=1 Tax=Mucilaginibacter gracilis TaxID=423350 RepID=A0A495J5P1_9SPHI|nr:hypothetical protein [Mucilaginibacter gracilis]RKR83299.1 hypothetical protein BDD43_3504 [Mucilaginibacter gracilis]